MPRMLNDNFFDDASDSTVVLDSSDSILLSGLGIIEKNAGLDAVGEFLAKRSEAFQTMTQQKNKPMVYGTMRKDKRASD